ncbi:MAG: rod-binding protein [Bdellovibrionales bacterium]|nr:rod-binding protein [Bdellovibrionales bacterium]
MFLDTMMQAMRGTVQESEFSLENPATKIYRGMLDQEISKQTAHSNSVGLADQIVAYLEQRGYNSNQASVHGRTKPGAALPPSSSAPGKAPAEQKVGDAAGVAEGSGQ